MRISKILVSTIVVVLIVSMFFIPSQQNAVAKPDDRQAKARVRVLADTDEKASAAAGKGCETVRETKGLKAMLCSPETASSLGLPEDIKIFKADTGANVQIGANVVQTGGDKGQGRKIVVLDSGYNYNHRELSSSYLGGKDFVNNDNDPMDDNGHGSHVAGLITADGIKPAARGTAPQAGIISGKVLDQDGSGFFSDVVAAIYWAVDGPDGEFGTNDDFKADAINLSMGTEPPYTFKYHCDDEMPSMTNAVKYALNKGVTVVVAAGNFGTYGVSIPGCISHSLTVGAVNYNDVIASFSGRGRPVDLSAPGVNLNSAWLGTATYVTTSGTSMSTPIVSGTVALIKHDHPWYSTFKVRQVLQETALDLGKEGRDWSYGYGRVVAPAAVE